MKNNKLWIIIGIVVLMLFLQYSEKKTAATPLYITDLTDISDVVGFTPLVYPNAIYVWSLSSGEFGRYSASYIDGFVLSSQVLINIFADSESSSINLTNAHIRLSYDGSWVIVYFPDGEYAKGSEDHIFYVANDGSTYYDSALTQDACTFANGCIGVQPLMITDLENIDTSGLTNEIWGCYDCWQFSFEHFITPLGLGLYVLDEVGWADDQVGLDEPFRILLEGSEVPADVRSGDFLSITYDGGQTKKIYLSAHNSIYDQVWYVANDGSTYYDSALTQEACTFANGCAGITYQYFLNEKTTYLNGGNFNTFITNANQWL